MFGMEVQKDGGSEAMIPAFEAIKAISNHRNNAEVVGTMTPNRY